MCTLRNMLHCSIYGTDRVRTYSNTVFFIDVTDFTKLLTYSKTITSDLIFLNTASHTS